MFYCKNCGAKIEKDDAKFCPKCGQKVEKKEQGAKQEINPQIFHKEEKPAPTENQTSSINIPSDSVKESDSIGTAKVEKPAIKKPEINDIKKPDIPKKEATPIGKKDKSNFLIIIMIAVIVVLGISGTFLYLYKTGKLKNISFLNKKTKKKSTKTKKNNSKKEKTKQKKNKIKKSKKSQKISTSQQPNMSVQSSAPTYVYKKTSNNSYSNNQSAIPLFKNSLSSATAYVTGVAPLSNGNIGNAPAVIISNVFTYGASGNPGGSITLQAKFYAETPSNFSGQNVKLTYEIYGNGITAYNNSYVDVKGPGIYSTALTIHIPSNFTPGTYSYVLTVSSPATIEESPVAYIKIL